MREPGFFCHSMQKARPGQPGAGFLHGGDIISRVTINRLRIF